MSRESNFLSRWSRLKRETEGKRAAVEPGDPAAASDTTAAPVAELTPEELAALPRIEELTAETDLAPFLRVGVPASLRNAALRRMWSLDPAIRNRVGDALDYAYDWNSPGSVPGAGQLLASDDVQRMLRDVLGEADPQAEAEQKTEPQGSAPDAAAGQPEPPAVAATSPDDRADTIAPADAAAQTEEIPQTRRHGSATPL